MNGIPHNTLREGCRVVITRHGQREVMSGAGDSERTGSAGKTILRTRAYPKTQRAGAAQVSPLAL